jgi:hypothetical protein
MIEITMSDLARKTGLSVPHICMLIKRGVCPPGRKDGKTVYLPLFESELALMGRKRRGKRVKKLTLKELLR